MSFSCDLLKGKTALVTGGGTGICRGLALALASHGCDVAITSRKADHLEPTCRDIEAVGVRALTVAGDVRDPTAVEQTVAATVDAFGRLDILVNGAAGNFLCLAEDLSPNGFGAVVDIDLKGTFHMCRSALPHLKKTGGTVLNISATLHYLGTVAQLHVSAAKAGIDALTRVLAVEWGPYGVRVNGIAPGAIMWPEVEHYEGLHQEIISRTALKRKGIPKDVADTALFLINRGNYTTGQIIAVDGGRTLGN